MEKQNRAMDILLKSLSYLLVAALAAAVTLVLVAPQPEAQSKLEELEGVIQEYFIDEVDKTAMEDAAAGAMVDALGDRWSYYLPKDQVQLRKDQNANSYVGIGVTIINREDGLGFDVLQVEPAGSAKEAGVLPGDIITAVEGQKASVIGTAGAQQIIRGEIGTDVTITIMRDGQEMDITITRQLNQVQVASSKLLEGKIGYVQIANFNDRCFDETKAAVEAMLEQGAMALIFDVRNNGGGYKHELVKVLDYLLPKGDLFRSLDYTGAEAVDTSDQSCLKMPMAVLINGNSYSAAEFFAAALEEYDWAVTVGEPTTGKGYFQTMFTLSDGSAVGLSVGKYFTPKGVSLAEVGGLVPGIPVETDEETAAMIYSGLLEPEEDPQVQAAVQALLAGF